jgi:hypothetical protein
MKDLSFMQMIFGQDPSNCVPRTKIIAGINLNKIDVRAVTGIVELSGKVIKQEVTANTGGNGAVIVQKTHTGQSTGRRKQPFTFEPVTCAQAGEMLWFMEVLRMSSEQLSVGV